MHDEIIKHAEKIVETSQGKNSLWEKMKDISIEILIIVFAVTISIWFHGLSEKHHQRQEAKEFLIDLKTDLNQDVTLMDTYTGRLKDFNVRLEKFNQFKTNQAGFNKLKISPLSPFINRETSSGDYDGFKSSGKIGYIDNKKLKSAILKYYQQNMLRLSNAEKVFNNLSMETVLRISDKGMESAFENSNIERLNMLGGVATEIVQSYTKQIADAKEMIAEIEKETR